MVVKTKGKIQSIFKEKIESLTIPNFNPKDIRKLNQQLIEENNSIKSSI